MTRCIPEKQWYNLLGSHRWKKAGFVFFCLCQPVLKCLELGGLNCFHEEVDDTAELIIKHSNVLSSLQIL